MQRDRMFFWCKKEMNGSLCTSDDECHGGWKCMPQDGNTRSVCVVKKDNAERCTEHSECSSGKCESTIDIIRGVYELHGTSKGVCTNNNFAHTGI